LAALSAGKVNAWPWHGAKKAEGAVAEASGRVGLTQAFWPSLSCLVINRQACKIWVIVLTGQVLNWKRFLLQPDILTPLHLQTMATENPFLVGVLLADETISLIVRKGKSYT
jgi:hypothetical protein